MRKKNRPLKEAARKNEIVDTAAKLFSVKGYHATSLEEVAKELGIARPSLYYHVDSKEQILQEILQKAWGNMSSVIKICESENSPDIKIRKVVQKLVELATERKDTVHVALEEIRIVSRRTQSDFRRTQKELEKGIQDVLREGVENGCFQIDDIKMTSFAILSISNSVYKWYRPDGGLTPVQIADKFVDILENGYLKR